MNAEPGDRGRGQPAAGENDRASGGQYQVDSLTGQNIAMGDGAQVNVTYVQQAPAVPEKPPHPAEPGQMIGIEAGEFIMGSDDAEPEEAPRHVVDLPAYEIAACPVSNRQFAIFVRETNRAAAPVLRWEGNRPPDEILDHPVAGVTWFEAMAYCDWLTEETERHYSLPSEAQWERAARGTNGRLFPWGDDWEPGRCNDRADTITAVETYPPQNGDGCYDLVGNVREWTTTLWGTGHRAPDEKYRYPWKQDDREDTEQPPGVRRVYRGGIGDEPLDFRCSARGAYLPDKPGPRGKRHGFRVVRLDLERK